MKISNKIKSDFPIFESKPGIIYLDSAATSQKPYSVMRAEKSYYENSNANPFRGAYQLSNESTEIYNNCRQTVAKFLNAKSADEIIFTKNATEALNLIAYSYGLSNVSEGDEIVLSIMEHHSNIVPWQMVAKSKKATLKYLYIDENFEIPENEIDTKITPKTKIVGVVSTSNVLGTKNNIEKIIEKAHGSGAITIIDISQSIAHCQFDVQKTDADFVVFSGHKMFGPTGIGVLYGKRDLLEKMPPFLMGGDMIEYVYEQDTTFAELPHKFEAGTQNVAGAVGLCAAIEYINTLGYDNIIEHEEMLKNYAIQKLKSLPYIELYCPNNIENASSLISFNIKNIHPHDVATLLDLKNICIRAGNHCAQPLMRFLKIDSTCRISFSIYNTTDDIENLVIALNEIYEKFKKYIKN